MPRYVAFLRGVSPMTAKMPELARAFEKGGFEEVRTVLGTGNVVFSAPKASDAALAARAEAAMKNHLARPFDATVRAQSALLRFVSSEPFAAYDLSETAKLVVTLLRGPAKKGVVLPISMGSATIHALRGRLLLSSYEKSEEGPVFMRLIEKTFGKDLTTRTLETVRKCAIA